MLSKYSSHCATSLAHHRNFEADFKAREFGLFA